MKEFVSSQEIEEATGKDHRWVSRTMRKAQCAWILGEPNGRGKPRKLFSVASLPSAIRARLEAHWLKETVERMSESGEWPHPIAAAGSDPLAGNGSGNANGGDSGAGRALVVSYRNGAASRVIVPEQAEKIGLAKYRLVHAWREMVASQPWGRKEETTQVFLTAYRTGTLLPGVWHLIGDVSEKTLYRLDRKLRQAQDDYRELCDGRGGWRAHGTTKWRERALPKEAQEALLICYLQPNRPTFRLAHHAALAILGKHGVRTGDLPSEATWRRWFEDWSKLHHDLVVLGREGEKAYIDQCAPFITRDTSRLEVGQVLVADGHDLNFEILHPETGRPCRMKLIVFFDWASRMPVGWQIMPTENVIAISAALRNAIVHLGKVPKVVYLDNGRAFKAKLFTETDPEIEELRGLYARLGIATIFAEPYRARSKVVERFFLTVGEQFEQLMPSYCGSDIAHKPAWRARNEKFHQAWKEARDQGWVPNIREAAHLIALYFKWYGEQPHEGIGRRRPIDVLLEGIGPGVDVSELNREFLWRVPVTPRRCRVRLYGIDYESDCLHGLRPEKGAAIAHIDTADLSRIYCTLPSGEYLGEAVPVQALPPIARILGDEIGVDQVQSAIKRQRRLARETKQKLIELGVTTETASATTALPWQERRPVLLSGGREDGGAEGEAPSGEMQAALDAGEEKRLALVYSRVVEAEEAGNSEAPKIERPEFFPSEPSRYDWCFRTKHEHGQALGREDELFMAYYEETAEFQENFRQRYEDLKELFELYR